MSIYGKVIFFTPTKSAFINVYLKDGLCIFGSSEDFFAIRGSNSDVLYHVDHFSFQYGKIKCWGWALECSAEAPVKRVMLLKGNVVLSISAPIMRTDVRISTQVPFDMAGFEFVDVNVDVSISGNFRLLFLNSDGFKMSDNFEES